MIILIVDNDSFFLSALQLAFEIQGCQVIATTDSLIASELFFHYRPEAVILSVCMSDKDGFELTQEIRKLCQQTFILAISTHELYLRIIKKLGANEALSKAVKPELIASLFRKALFYSCLQANFFKQSKCESCEKIPLCAQNSDDTQ